MIARTKRLRLGRDIDRVLGRGRFGASGDIWTKALGVPGGESRVAIIVSKKVSKKAVVRNRIRRQMFAVVQSSWATLRPGCDIVVAARADVSGQAPKQLAADIDRALVKAGAKQSIDQSTIKGQ